MADTYYKNDSYPSMRATQSWGNIGQVWDDEDKRARMMDKPWYDDFIQVLRDKGNLENFIKEKNAKVYQDYMYDKAHYAMESKKRYEKDLNEAQTKLDTFDKQTQLATYFCNVAKSLSEAYPEDKQTQLSQVLNSYLRNGEFSQHLVSNLMKQPSGLINKIKNGKKISKANEILSQVMESFKKKQIFENIHNVPYPLDDMVRNAGQLKSGRSYQSAIENKRKEFLPSIENYQSLIKSNDDAINTYQNSFEKEIAPKLEKEDALIYQFVEDLKNPKEFDHTKSAKTFLDDIKNMNDDEEVIFNFMMHPKKRFETMMQELGFEIGSGTDKWLCYVNENKEYKQSEVWSPVMTVKEAREVMPLIIDHMEAVGISHQGVIMPISGHILADIKKGGQENVPQFDFRQSLQDFLKECQTSENVYMKEQIKKEFQETSVFNGTMVSDDYFPWSKRAGRNGVVYAGIDLGYILQYDGAKGNGNSGTTDFYIPTKIGEVEIGGEPANVTIGFVNVYEQAKGVDRFYPNFGMEDNKMPYWGRPELDSETFVTPDKNPLKAKFMHIVIGGGREFFYKIPEKPDAFVQYILEQKKGDVRHTFEFNLGYSPLARLYNQADEIKNGNIKGSGKRESLSEFMQKAASSVKNKEKEQVNEMVKIEEPVNKEEAVKKEDTVAEVQPVQQTEVKAEVAKSPKELVAEKLKAMGMEDGSYMMIDKNDDFYTLYDGANGPEGRSVKGYLESGKEEIAKTGKDAVYCSNNGIVGAYFKEGVYVLTTDYGLKNALYLRGEETSLGVMLSNGEPFVNKDGKIDEEAKVVNTRWFGDKDKGIKGIRDKGDQVYAERVEAYQARKKWREELENATAADKVHHSLKSLVEFADKHDKSGQLKDRLVKSFMQEPEKMLTLEFWGNCAKEYADKSCIGKDAFIQEMCSFGLDIGKDIKANQNNLQYQAVKKRCAECKNSDDMLKTAKSCAARSHNQAEQYFEAAKKR